MYFVLNNTEYDQEPQAGTDGDTCHYEKYDHDRETQVGPEDYVSEYDATKR